MSGGNWRGGYHNGPAAATGGDAEGKELFNANCAACHKLDAKATGPALEGLLLSMKWHGFTRIKNSSELIKSGDPQAVKFMKKTTRQ
jgi:cytochrome c2